jgi:glycosyltransferase involved in cell wall biosynthesis
MRIAIVAGPYVPIPPKQYGGIEQVVYYLIKGLREAGHEPILIGPGDSTVDCKIIPNVDKALYFPRTKRERPAHRLKVKAAERRTKRIIKALLPSIDLIHAHGFDISDFSDFPNLTTIHNRIELQSDIPTEDLSYYLKRSDLYYASISKNQQAVCPDLNFVDVVYNGEDPSKFPLIRRPQNYLCFLGRLDRDKNPHMAIQLALSLGIKIKLAGKVDFASEGYFEQEVAKYFDHPLVEYLGEIGFEEKIKLLSHAKCNLHPTKFREPFGLTVLEAAYCGTPTLAVNRGAMPELIERGKTGVLVEDFVEGRHYIEKCYQMDRTYIAERARRLFNYQNMTRGYVDAYGKVIRKFPALSQNDSLLSRFMQYTRGPKTDQQHEKHLL